MNFSLAIDNLLANELRHLAPHKSTFDMAKPYNVSVNLSIPKPVIATTSNWLMTLEDIGRDKTDKMIALANE